MMVYNWLKNTQIKLFPYFCSLCGDKAQAHIAICEPCHKQLITINNCCTQCALPLPDSAENNICGQCLNKPPYFDHSFSLYNYETPVKQLISGLKFQKKLSLAHLFGTLLGEAIQHTNRCDLPDCIAPVPLSSKRLKNRGYNQSIEIARPVSKLLSIPLAYNLFKRVRHSPPQSSLNLKSRQHNVRNAFTINEKKLPRHIAIIDDVMTTGATSNELARILKKEGVEKVEIWSVARATRD